jgi:hypothetical protein
MFHAGLNEAGESLHPDALVAHNMANDTVSDSRFQWLLSLGSKRFPDAPVTSLSETFEQLRTALAIHGNDILTTDMTALTYALDKYIIGVCTERIPGAPWSGISMKQGELIRFDFKNMPTSVAANNNRALVDRCWIVLCADSVISIEANGVSLFD